MLLGVRKLAGLDALHVIGQWLDRTAGTGWQMRFRVSLHFLLGWYLLLGLSNATPPSSFLSLQEFLDVFQPH